MLAGGLALLLVTASACTEDDDGDEGASTGGGSGDGVTISGPETGAEADGFQAALDVFGEESDVEVTYSGSCDFESQIRVAA